MGMFLEWRARNMHLSIVFMCSVHGLGNFVWEASDMRSFSHMHAMGKVHQHDTTQADNSSNSVDMKLCITRLIYVQNTRSVMSGKMKMADFGLISRPNTRVHILNTTQHHLHVYTRGINVNPIW
jgi:hypothetical protein